VKEKTMAAKKPPLGSGARFKALAKKTGSPAIAAAIGDKKYGAKKMGQMAAKGRARAAGKRGK
jgi:hypothetical protein